MENSNNLILEKISKEIIEIRKVIEKRQDTFMNRFLLGIVGGFGAVIGATLIVAILLYFLTKLATIDFLKPVIEQIIDIINSKQR